MNVQVIMRDGEAEYAVVPWADYQALLATAGAKAVQAPSAAGVVALGAEPTWRELRESKGFSLEHVARSVGISPSYLELIESGEREASEAIQHGLRRALGVGAGS